MRPYRKAVPSHRQNDVGTVLLVEHWRQGGLLGARRGGGLTTARRVQTAACSAPVTTTKLCPGPCHRLHTCVSTAQSSVHTCYPLCDTDSRVTVSTSACACVKCLWKDKKPVPLPGRGKAAGRGGREVHSSSPVGSFCILNCGNILPLFELKFREKKGIFFSESIYTVQLRYT